MGERSSAEQLTELRESIAEVDRSLLELLHRRMHLAAEVGRVKAGEGQPIMVPEVHHRVLSRARQHADACGVAGREVGLLPAAPAAAGKRRPRARAKQIMLTGFDMSGLLRIVRGRGQEVF